MKILIIEDNEKLASAIKRGLEQEGYAADYLLDGESGERKIESGIHEYDLVVLDVMLPKRDGIAVCKSWREKDIAIPVIMLTAKDTTEDKIAGLNCGADDYLVKPFSFDELVARIRALLRRPKEVLPNEIKIGDIVLDTATRKVTCAGKEIALTLKEFMVLEYLMRHPSVVVTRDELYDHAWDFAANPLSNTVDAHIKNLRKKIGRNRHEEILETIRGVGYRLKA
ncbi:response regulator transcription factor [Patescibacteria group bacterium]|nr:response regulator transcription factor [Patescibacteria group bacterium]